MSWVGKNNLANSISKIIEIELERGNKFLITVTLNSETWLWEASIRDLSGSVTTPESAKLSARTPHRAAARAIECLLGMADRGELAH